MYSSEGAVTVTLNGSKAKQHRNYSCGPSINPFLSDDGLTLFVAPHSVLEPVTKVVNNTC